MKNYKRKMKDGVILFMKKRSNINYSNYLIDNQAKLSPYEVFNRISRLLEIFSLNNNKKQQFAFSDGIVITLTKRTKVLYICLFIDSQYNKSCLKQEFVVESQNQKNCEEVNS